jgi:hypothetical protein
VAKPARAPCSPARHAAQIGGNAGTCVSLTSPLDSIRRRMPALLLGRAGPKALPRPAEVEQDIGQAHRVRPVEGGQVIERANGDRKAAPNIVGGHLARDHVQPEAPRGRRSGGHNSAGTEGPRAHTLDDRRSDRRLPDPIRASPSTRGREPHCCEARAARPVPAAGHRRRARP